MIKLSNSLTIRIDLGHKVSAYPLIVQTDIGKEESIEFSKFKKKQDAKDKKLIEATKTTQALTKAIERLKEDLSDLNAEIEDNNSASLRKKRKKTRNKLRTKEDQLEAFDKENNLTVYQNAIDARREASSQKVFELNVDKTDKRDALVEAIDKHGIKYSLIVSEIGRLMVEAQKKKKKRS